MTEAEHAQAMLDQLRKVHAEFGGKDDLSQKALDEFCERTGYKEYIEIGTYQDFLYAFNFDVIMTAIVPKIIACLAKIKYTPETSTPEQLKKIHENNEQVITDIKQILIDHDVPVRMLDNIDTFGKSVGFIISTAQKQLENMSARVLEDIGNRNFDTKEMTVKHLFTHDREVIKGVKLDK